MSADPSRVELRAILQGLAGITIAPQPGRAHVLIDGEPWRYPREWQEGLPEPAIVDALRTSWCAVFGDPPAGIIVPLYDWCVARSWPGIHAEYRCAAAARSLAEALAAAFRRYLPAVAAAELGALAADALLARIPPDASPGVLLASLFDPGVPVSPLDAACQGGSWLEDLLAVEQDFLAWDLRDPLHLLVPLRLCRWRQHGCHAATDPPGIAADDIVRWLRAQGLSRQGIARLRRLPPTSIAAVARCWSGFALPECDPYLLVPLGMALQVGEAGSADHRGRAAVMEMALAIGAYWAQFVHGIEPGEARELWPNGSRALSVLHFGADLLDGHYCLHGLQHLLLVDGAADVAGRAASRKRYRPVLHALLVHLLHVVGDDGNPDEVELFAEDFRVVHDWLAAIWHTAPPSQLRADWPTLVARAEAWHGIRWTPVEAEAPRNLAWTLPVAGFRIGGIEVVPLCTSQALVEEGREMQHCVGSYDQHCKAGQAAIYSFRYAGGGERIATAQYGLRSGRWQKVQVKGRGNAQRDPAQGADLPSAFVAAVAELERRLAGGGDVPPA